MIEALQRFVEYRNSSRHPEREARSAYLDLVKQFARNEELDADLVDAVLDETGKTEDELQKDVEIQQKRYQWAEQLEDVTRARGELAAAQAEFDKTNKRIADFLFKHRPALDAARDRMADCQRRIDQEHAVIQLLGGHQVDGGKHFAEAEKPLIERRHSLASEIETTERQLQSATRSLEDLEKRTEWLNSALRPGRRQHDADHYPEYRESLKRAREAIKHETVNQQNHNQRLAELSEQYREINGELDRIAELRLEP